ncbi:hypothetical protein FRC07_013608, partial [Ceratobasidium sp. 392]
CITGSHIRPPKLSANAYAVLQLITRTRREGISAADISRQSGYDPKTCFYFIKILVDLGHILKIKVGGAAVNICVHKSFYDDQCVWKQATKEAAEPKLDTGAEAEAEEEDDDEGCGKEFTTSIQFEPIDNRHMTNPTVVKARIERLLRHMPDGLHVYRHLLEAIGFKTSLKKERRVFTHRVTELIKSRFIEKVWAHSNASSTGRVLCIRLVSSDPIQKDVDVAEDGAGDDPNDNAGGLEGAASGEGVGQGEPDAACGQAWPEGVYATQSVASQIISMVEQSDTTGMTLAEISKNLHNFDVRSVTNLIARFSAGQPPTHLTHRALIITTETFGRERRQRVYTLTAYRKMTEQEGLEDHSVLDPKDSGTWALFEPEDFLADEEEREEWLETFVREALVHGGERVQQRRGKKKRVNPLGKNGAPVKGRPRNEWAPGPKVAKKRGRPPKRKMDEVDDDGEADQPPATKKRRGRPPKSKTTNDSTLADDSVLNAANNSPSTSNTSPAKVTRSRARPRMKNPAQSDPGVSLEQDSVGPAHREGVDERPAVGIQGNSTLETSVTVADIAPQGPTGKQSKKRGRGSATKPTSRLVSHPSSPDSPSNQTHTYKRPRLTKTQSQQLDTGSVDSPGLIQTERQEAVSIVVPSVENSSSAPPLEGLIPIPDREIEPTPALEATDNGPAVATGQIPDSVQVERCTTQPAPRQGKTTNVSALRRQTEFLQLIESMGGVANISLLKSFSDEHQKLLQTLQAAGKAVSAAPGSEMDKRTFTSTISALEGRGLVKKLVVSALTTNGTTRRATIVHLNTASPESVEKCIDEFRSSGSTKGIPLPSDFPKVSESVSHVSKKKTAPKPAPSPSPDPTPPPMDPLSVARHANLSDPKTAAQYAGYIFGHFSRARILHLRLVSEIASGTPPASLASPSARVFSRDYFFGDLPVATYCIIIPQSTVIPGLKEMLEAELAPVQMVSDFFSGKRANIQRDLVNIQALAKQEAEVVKRQAEEARLALAAKAAQAKKDQETRWDSIVSNALDGLIPPHPRFQKALASLKAEFTVSPQQPSNAGWETKIQKALRDSLGAKPFIIAPPAPAPAASGTNNKPQEVSGSSVSTLILQQGAPIQQKDITPKKSGRKSKKQIEAATTAAEKENTTPESETRRRRFPWNPDYDELARDAGAIVRVRCRSKRMDWSALEQVFPGVQRNSVRQRISSLETLPGASEYYRRLDDAWLALWLEHHGSDALPDPNPDSPSDFDLPAHVVFLRQHIDKEALHAGSETQKTEGSKGAIQLTSVEQIIADYNITEASSASQPTSWDFCFDLASEEPREREFLQHPFVVSDLATIESDVPLDVSVAQAAVKHEIYNMDDAALLGALATLTQTSPPLAYALGYDQARVVSASVLPEWIVQTVQFRSNSNGSKFNMVFPRQWLDIYGNLLEDIWTMATRSLAGSLMYRPSINEYTLRQRYSVLFDRQELNDILRYLLAIGKLKRITDTDLPVEIHSGDKGEFEANNKAYLVTAALLANRASNYGLPSTPEELDEDQQGILNDLSQGVALRFEPPEPLSIGRLIFDLDSSAGLAKTCANFVSLCKGDQGMCKNAPNKPLHYKGSAIHRIARDFVAQGGDVTRDDGSGGESIYGGKFADAKEGLKAKPELGSLAMANSGKNSNTSQFFIVLTGDTAKLAKISGKYVVFGKARLADGGEEILARLGALAGNDEKPIKPVWIEECGVLS